MSTKEYEAGASAHGLTPHGPVYTVTLIATEVCSQRGGSWEGGESSCSLDAAPVWADKGHAGEAL